MFCNLNYKYICYCYDSKYYWGLETSHTNNKTHCSIPFVYLNKNFDLLDHVDKLRDVIDVFVPDGILSLILGLPEIDFKWLCLVREQSDDLIKKLDGLLRLLDALVKNVTNLILRGLVAEAVNLVVFEFDGDDRAGLLEDLLDLVLRGRQRDVFHVEVRLEHLFLVLLDLTTLLKLTLLLVDVRGDEDSLTFNMDLHVRRV